MTTRQIALLLIAAGCTAFVLHRIGVTAWLRSVGAKLLAMRPPGWAAKHGGNVALLAIAAFCVVAVFGLPSVPSINWPKIEWPSIVVPAKSTAVTYVYEKDSHVVPAPVMAALNTLNRQGIVGTIFEQDTTDGDGQVPDQYKIPLAAAKEAGLPALVVTGGDKVIRTIKAPTTEAAVLEAAK